MHARPIHMAQSSTQPILLISSLLPLSSSTFILFSITMFNSWTPGYCDHLPCPFFSFERSLPWRQQWRYFPNLDLAQFTLAVMNQLHNVVQPAPVIHFSWIYGCNLWPFLQPQHDHFLQFSAWLVLASNCITLVVFNFTLQSFFRPYCSFIFIFFHWYNSLVSTELNHR